MELKRDTDLRMETWGEWERWRSEWGEKHLNESQTNQLQKTESYYWRQKPVVIFVLCGLNRQKC
jgi:hypothetical protein